MTTTIITLVVLACLIGLILLAKKLRLLPGRSRHPYAKQDALLTPAEITFHSALEQAVGGQFRIMAKVRMADLIRVAGAVDRKENQSAFNKISGKHLDFVLVDPRTFTIVCAVELDDSSHNRSDRMDRDDFVNDALADAGLPLLRVKARANYNPLELQQALAETLAAPQKKQPAVQSQPSAEPVAPVCPSCGATMLLRTAKKGDRAGESFWGCPGYPICRATMPVQ